MRCINFIQITLAPNPQTKKIVAAIAKTKSQMTVFGKTHG